jgi:predicted HTH domain antitoxin
LRDLHRHAPTAPVFGSCRSDRRAFLGWLLYTEIVKIWLDLPDAAVKQLAEDGEDLSRAALEALAIDAYRMHRISGHQLCQLLDIPSRHDLDGFLKRHGVPLEYSFEDFEHEAATSARLWQKRQAEQSAAPIRDRRSE